MSKLFLQVPYAEKNEAKALGARWDSQASKWYVPDGIDQAAFAKWAGAIAQQPATPPSPAPISSNGRGNGQAAQSNDNHQTLSAFLGSVGQVISKHFTAPTWIQVEVSKVNNRSAHAYFDLVEYDDTGKEVAKARASLWSSKKNKIFDKFKKVTGSDIADGMKLLFLLKAEFAPQFGFGFTIEDVDPAYTLGDMQAKVKAIREALIKAGIYGENKKHAAPVDFTRVAVISPENAAGLADFTREATILQDAGLCEFAYFSAVFQGKDASESIRRAFRQMLDEHTKNPFDALVVIRGGGAAADLAWLNDYELAEGIALMPLPVFTGIGHQIDDTILDEVSFRRFDTPSKVSAFITSVIVTNAENAANNYLAIITGVGRAIAMTEGKLNLLMGSIRSDAMQTLQKAESQIDMQVVKLQEGAHSALNRADQYLNTTMAEIIGLSPKKTQERGYAIVRGPSGRPLTSAEAIKDQDSVSLDMHDGLVKLEVIKEN
ncbi:exodeoxyribonuclease VII large subunit [Methylobacillus sp. Pita2]|uniref:exodeoxyribonuclease VII large subunit n=1 Tax=Methylobacillus sp. Pita2 TaxID=3383245 RepID=UPI0038B51EAE